MRLIGCSYLVMHSDMAFWVLERLLISVPWWYEISYELNSTDHAEERWYNIAASFYIKSY